MTRRRRLVLAVLVAALFIISGFALERTAYYALEAME